MAARRRNRDRPTSRPCGARAEEIARRRWPRATPTTSTARRASPTRRIAALRQARLLSAYVPAALGGGGCSLRELIEMCEALGRALRGDGDDLRHAPDPGGVPRAPRAGRPLFRAYLRRARGRAAAHRVGDLGGRRRRRHATQRLRRGAAASERFRLEKDAHHHLLRRAGRRPAGHRAARARLRRRATRCWCSSRRRTTSSSSTGTWDTLGMRGTCSPPVS